VFVVRADFTFGLLALLTAGLLVVVNAMELILGDSVGLFEAG
jgi:hypothetical protein